MPIRQVFQQKFQRQTGIDLPQKRNQGDSKLKRRRCLVWIKLALSASIPLMIAIFTVISYIQTNEINERNRQKDIEIANQTRLQEQQLAHEQHHEDQQQADELHYQTLFGNYIEEISTAIYKQSGQNQSMFISEDNKMLYIRRKTLLILRSIDSDRKNQLFIFLYENKLLPDAMKPNSTVDLTGADLSNIIVKSPITGKYNFSQLSLLSVNLMNATFIDCIFDGQTDFNGSILVDAQFVDTGFHGKLNAFSVDLTNASFTGCHFHGQTDFSRSILTNAHFIHTEFHEKLNAFSVNLTNASFLNCQFWRGTHFNDSNLSTVNFQRTEFNCLDRDDDERSHIFSQSSMVFIDFREAHLCDVQFEGVDLSYANFSEIKLLTVFFINTNLSNSIVNIRSIGISTLKNIVLPNGTWLIDSSNHVKNSDAEENVTQ
ncbi:unnamed protein product [Rotaria sp. Silwood1]|nr:unnamed protein product [Rotaria sp. Silwood1]